MYDNQDIPGGIAGFLIASRIVRTKRQANTLLLVIFIASILGTTAFWFLNAGPSEEKEQLRERYMQETQQPL